MSTKGLKPGAPDATLVYADIINMPRHVSTTHAHMPMIDRAAQFSPFAALSGYDDMIVEEGRYVEAERAVDESSVDGLDHALAEIDSALECGDHPEVDIRYFEPDPHKIGGTYVQFHGSVKKIDMIQRDLVFYGAAALEEKRISLDRIVEISPG